MTNAMPTVALRKIRVASASFHFGRRRGDPDDAGRHALQDEDVGVGDERDRRVEERPERHVDREQQAGCGEQEAGVDEEDAIVDRSPLQPAADEQERGQHERQDDDRVVADGGDEPEDPAREQRPDPLAEEVRERRRGIDAVHLGDRPDEQDLAVRGRRRDAPEGRELAQPPRADDDEEQREARDGAPPRDRRFAAELGSPGPPAVPQEHEGEGGADEDPVVAGEGRQADEHAGDGHGSAIASQGSGAHPDRRGPQRFVDREVVRLAEEDGRGGGDGGHERGADRDGRAGAHVAGDEPGQRRSGRPDERERDVRHPGGRPEHGHERQLDDRREGQPVGIAGDRQVGIGRQDPPVSTNAQMKSTLNPWPAWRARATST